MKKTMVLLAGYPGTGKSYICKQILDIAPDFLIVSQDTIKEAVFDELGYDNLIQKEQLTLQSWELYYQQLETAMKEGRRILSDYPFSEKQRPRLQALREQYAYEVITIRLLADLDILYERQRKRDLDPTRHISHIMSHYHRGDVLENRLQADGLLSREEFIKRCTTRGYDTFQLGHLMEADVSDFSKVDYSAILKELSAYL